jgi:hypothetical protein
MTNDAGAPRLHARITPPAIGIPIEIPAKLHAFAGTTN